MELKKWKQTMVGSLDICTEFKNVMKYIKTLIFALLFTMVMPQSQAGDTTMVYTQVQVEYGIVSP